MAITIREKSRVISYEKASGITAGNEFIYPVPEGATVSFAGTNTAAGTATLKYSFDPSTPTDFTGFFSAEAGAQSASFTDSTGTAKGLRWVGLDVTSGTWTGEVIFVLDSDSK